MPRFKQILNRVKSKYAAHFIFPALIQLANTPLSFKIMDNLVFSDSNIERNIFQNYLILIKLTVQLIND